MLPRLLICKLTGRALIMAAGALLIVGFSEAADYGFHTPRAYAVIAVGAVFFCAAIAHFMTTKRVAIIPAVSLCLPMRRLS
jgi:hypothetical protein